MSRRPPPIMLALLALGPLLGQPACDYPPGHVEPDAPRAPRDAATGPCGPPTTLQCVPGAIGRACGDVTSPMVCSGGLWSCSTGTILPGHCGCRAGTGAPGLPPKLRGAACEPEDAGPDARDGATEDANEDANETADDATDAGD